MRLIALVESPEHVCCRYRLESFRAHLEASGHTLELRTLPRGLFARVSLFRELRTSDVVVLQRKLLPRIQLAMLRRYARRIVFDFDDAVWHRDSYDVKGLHSYRRIRRFARTSGGQCFSARMDRPVQEGSGRNDNGFRSESTRILHVNADNLIVLNN